MQILQESISRRCCSKIMKIMSSSVNEARTLSTWKKRWSISSWIRKTRKTLPGNRIGDLRRRTDSLSNAKFTIENLYAGRQGLKLKNIHSVFRNYKLKIENWKFYSSSSSVPEEFFNNGMKRKYSRSWSQVNLPMAMLSRKIIRRSSGNAKSRCFNEVRKNNP